MKRPSVGTVLSLFLNLILSAWLFQQYLNDQYFHNYVDAAAAPVFPYLVLTMGIGGGSTLGYILLRRKHSSTGVYGRLQKAKPLKQSGPLPATAGTSFQSKNVPVGTPPGPTSKHTAYAVPSLPKSSTPTVSKTSPSTSWSISAKQTPASPLADQQEQRTPSTNPQAQFSSPSRTEPFSRQEAGSQLFPQATKPETNLRDIRSSQSTEQSPRTSFSTIPPAGGGLSRIPPISGTEPLGKSAPPGQWGIESAKPEVGIDKGNTQFQKPFPDSPSQPGFRDQPSGERLGRPPQPPAQFQQVRPADTSKPGQWTDPVPRQGYSPPQKWAPPSVSPVPSSRPQAPINPLQRPGQPPQGRPPFPGAQGPPRPLAFPGSMRTPPSSVITGPFRPDQPRPAGPDISPRQPAQGQRPVPGQWTPRVGENKDSPSPSKSQPSPSLTTSQPETRPKGPELQAQTSASGESSGGEMDWDTALDTILKTLRKDKVGDKP